MEVAGEVDYVVIGAGSAGCVVAARLSESGGYTVALLEAGGEDDGFWIRVPMGFGKLFDDPHYIWPYESEPEAEIVGGKMYASGPEAALGSRSNFQPRGRVLGGTGSINGSVYQRGSREDFDHWRQLGNVGWGYEQVLPYFKKAEDNELGPDTLYGADGPIRVATSARDPLSRSFVTAAVEAGYALNEHGFNGRSQEGFGYNQTSIRDGRRCSTANAYLHPARRRQNLRVIIGAFATRVLFEGREARGIEYRCNGSVRRLIARREVILAAGAFNSPQLLQVSGIGPAALLGEHGIPVVANLPGVGENLQNHLAVTLKYQCSQRTTINDVLNNPLRRIAAGMRYLLFRKGPLATNALIAAGMMRTDPTLPSPDVKVQLQNWLRSGQGKVRMGLEPFSGFTVTLQLMHPDARGTVRIRSGDTSVAPEIRFNYLLPERDRATIIAGLRAIRKIMSMPAIAPYVAKELAPGPQCRTDDELLADFRKRAMPGFHTTSTCRMGVDDMAVVDPRLRVRGFKRLRVIDASIMPRNVGANTNATTVMIAEKGSAMVLEDATGI